MPVCFICFVLFEHLNLLTPSKIYINLSRFYLYSNLSDNQPFYFLISWSLQTAFPGTCISYHQGLPYNFENSLISLSHLTNRLYVDFGVESHFFPSTLKIFPHRPLASLVTFEKLIAFLAIHIICVFSPESFIISLSLVFWNSRWRLHPPGDLLSFTVLGIRWSFHPGYSCLWKSWFYYYLDNFFPIVFLFLEFLLVSYWIICNDLPLTIFFLLLCKVFF